LGLGETVSFLQPYLNISKMAKSQLYKFKKIAGMYYPCSHPVRQIVVYGIGAPLPPDNGTLPGADIINRAGFDLFVPDYLGYGRSDGVFTPKNCIKTFLNLYDYFTTGCVGKNTLLNKTRRFKYRRVVFVGRSFGGTYVPLLPRFNPLITELILIFPVVDSASCGSVPGEETNRRFLESMKKDGYHHLYRGILASQWGRHLENLDDLSPMSNIRHLSRVKMFIGHGKQDRCVSFTKSLHYGKLITKMFPKGQFKYKFYPLGGHDPFTAQKSIRDGLNWLNSKKVL
jgi:hypothetical protein